MNRSVKTAFYPKLTNLHYKNFRFSVLNKSHGIIIFNWIIWTI